MVKSQSNEDQSYIVNLQFFSCDCSFHEIHSFCKHIFACEVLADAAVDNHNLEISQEPEFTVRVGGDGGDGGTNLVAPVNELVQDDVKEKIDVMLSVFERYRSCQKLTRFQEQIVNRV